MKNTTHNLENGTLRQFLQHLNRPHGQILQDSDSTTTHLIFNELDSNENLEKDIYTFLGDQDPVTITHIPNTTVITLEH